MGRNFHEVDAERKTVSYRVIAGPDGGCKIPLQNKDYSPEEISAAILSKLKVDAEKLAAGEVWVQFVNYYPGKEHQEEKP